MDPDPIESGEAATTVVETCAIHNINAWLVPGETGSSCTSGGAYCFLHTNIAFEDEEDEMVDREGTSGAEEDMSEYSPPSKTAQFESNVTALKRYITIMIHQGLDVATVVENVYKMYNMSIRPSVPDFVNPVTGTRISTPEWTRDSILNHLMESTDSTWSSLFSGACTIMLRKLILKANTTVVDKATGRFITDNAELLCKFIDRHDKHLIALASIEGKAHSSKRRRVLQN